ncbi:Hypothetical predicted protein, partial [Pelobates cultripes]
MKKKKEASRYLMELKAQIHILETQHKRSQLEAVYKELLNTRRQLKDILLRQHFKGIQRSKGFFYTHANKGDKYLARMLKGP